MPITKLCANCDHIKTLHHLVKGESTGSCSVATCGCTGYKNRAERAGNRAIVSTTDAREELQNVRRTLVGLLSRVDRALGIEN